eukprot:GFKZ01002654.1.p1 GENE.GFKZ01002654.1~~GFKZ01002654.1.p1  ORF type:complete len:858 (-),score=102.37 GFKZ01002654.1:181-2754(-)
MTFREHWETLKACSAPNILRRRRWHPRLSRWTITDHSPDLYSIVQLTPSDLVRTITQCQTNHHDPWDGPVSSVTAILYAVHLKHFIPPHTPPHTAHTAHITPAPGHYVAVLPFRSCSHGIVAVPEEIQEALGDMHHTLRQEQRAAKLSASAMQDVEAGHADPAVANSVSYLHPPGKRLLVFGAVRFSVISERKFRRIGVPEYLCKIKRAFQVQGPRLKDRCTLVMALIDLQQCGLMPLVKVEKFFDEYNPVIVTIDWAELSAYVDSVSEADSLLWDLLISVNDYELPENYGYLLDLAKVEVDSGMLSQYHAVEPKRLEKAIREVFAVQRGMSRAGDDGEYEYDEGEDHDEDAILSEALHYALGLALNGVDPDYPRKIIGLGWGFHLLNQGDGHLIPYKRLVKSVSSAGYRVRKVSIWMWVAVGLGCVLPIAYIAIRSATADVAFEELINTAISLVALYIALASPTLFQTVYRGERLTDVLSNFRNIDSQEEFDDREACGQHTDILEVIRLARRPPRFFGGQNMSYLRQARPEGLLDARRPILFPNLELAGYSLFEDKLGNLFMLDRWTNIFEVVIGRKLLPSTQLTDDSPTAQPHTLPELNNLRSSPQSSFTLDSMLARRQSGIKHSSSTRKGEEGGSPGGSKASASVNGSPTVESAHAPRNEQEPGKAPTQGTSDLATTAKTPRREKVTFEQDGNTRPASSGSLPVQPPVKSDNDEKGIGQPHVKTRKAKSNYSGHTRLTSSILRENKYLPESAVSGGALNGDNTLGMGIYCHPVKQTVWLRVNHITGSFKVRYVSTDGRTIDKEITRVLPYRARKRQVESHDWRQASVETWEVITNSTLLTLPIGMNVRDSVAGF